MRPRWYHVGLADVDVLEVRDVFEHFAGHFIHACNCRVLMWKHCSSFHELRAKAMHELTVLNTQKHPREMTSVPRAVPKQNTTEQGFTISLSTQQDDAFVVKKKTIDIVSRDDLPIVDP